MFFRGRCGKTSDKLIDSISPVLFLLALFFMFFFPAGAVADQAIVREAVVNLRSAPDTNSSIVGKAAQGESLEVLGKEGDWYQVSKNGAASWVAGWLVNIKAGSGGQGQVVVKEAVVNLRSAPDTGSSIVGKAAQGESLEVLGKQGDWYKVSKNGTACWVAGWLVEIKQASAAVSPVQPPPASGGSSSLAGEVTEDGINIRSGPGTTYSIVGQAGKGNKYSFLDKSGNWYKINISGGTGWISGQYVKESGGASSSGEQAGESSWAVINGIGVNIRTGPGTSYQVVTRANTGDRFLLADRSADWYKVVLSNGKLGWVAGWLVDVEKGTSGSGQRPGGESQVARGKQIVPPSSNSGNTSPSGEKPAGPGQPIIPPQAPGGAGNAATAVLKSVSARLEGGNTIITVQAEKGPISYEISSLNDPDRLVIDLKGMEPGQAPDSVAVSSPLAGGIRVGWLSKNPNITRVVVDLKSRVRYERSLSSDSSRLDVVLMPRSGRSLSGATVVLDPGHGGSDPGAIGPSGLKEKDVNLNISMKAAQYLRKEGATVVLTRTGDSYVDLAERPNVASKSGAALFVSIHSNANPSIAMNGTTTYYLLDAAEGTDQVKFESMYLSKYLQSSLVQALKRPDRGVLKANFLVLVKSKVPAALVEVAFVSNSEEEKMLRDGAFQDKAAQAIAKGIADYMAAR